MKIFFNNYSTINQNQTAFTSQTKLLQAGQRFKNDTLRTLKAQPDKLMKLKDKIVKLVAKGLTLKTISEHLGLSEYLIYKISHEFNIHKEGLDARNKIILRKYLAGENLQKIIKQFKITKVRAYEILMKEGGFKKRKDIEKNKVIELLQQGLSKKEVAEISGAKLYKVQKYMGEFGVTVFRRIDRDKKILDMLLQGYSRQEIAENLGVKKTLVIRIAEQNNAFKIFKAKRDKEILELVNAKVPYKEIKEKYNVSEATIGRIVRANKKIK